MKSLYSILLACILLACISCNSNNNGEWTPGESPLLSKWASEIDTEKPWNQYPRPGMVRSEWINLNGLWEFTITKKGETAETWDSKILVPYPVESALSGITERVGENDELWYKRTIKIPGEWNEIIMLNFEASDWETKVFIDGELAGSHRGGYDPFSIDISDFVSAGSEHELSVSVWDPTDKGTQPRGKQVSKPGGIWYTPSSGIWQTVWMESLPGTYIESFRLQTDIGNGTVSIRPVINNPEDDISISAEVSSDGNKVAAYKGKFNGQFSISVPEFELWTPSNPVLYDIELVISRDGEELDRVKSYTGFRKVSLGDAGDGFTRILLNDEFLFQNGPLDQGFWPDGLYTPPTEEAMVYDLEMTKDMGFNMLRKHVKIESRRFYYWCDKMGILVWQDMPSGDKYIHGEMPDIDKSPEDIAQFKFELAAMIESKYNNPSIIIWVPYNEGWGQYDTPGITDFVKELDP
ncbi:MAG: glycoside hydrolase family 2 TIM barrel-domain containing protein, partial [Eudoraea sp.]|nr:glycoside hydrolase family 2 TIM barrel-domain containing protein [Eudoraea sp.]